MDFELKAIDLSECSPVIRYVRRLKYTLTTIKMPSAKAKELRLAKNMGELNKMAQIQEKINKNANPKT